MDDTRTQERLDELRGRMADADFWFGEHSIPQYELLVRDGLLSQAEADDYRAQRTEMGLPMTFAELEAAPHEAFRWVKAAGGPSIGPEQELERAGVRWRVDVLGGRGRVLTYERSPNGDPDKFLSQEVTAAWDGNGLMWEASFQVSEHVFATRSNRVQTFDDAVAAVFAVDFKPNEFAGQRWYESGTGAEPGWVAAIDGRRVDLQSINAGDASAWRWQRSLDEGSPKHAMAKLFGGYQMSGQATTRDAAALDAIAAQSRLLGLAADLIGGDDFKAGRRAGIAAAQACLQAL